MNPPENENHGGNRSVSNSNCETKLNVQARQLSAAGACGHAVPVEQARAYVAKMDPAISGRGGHNQTFKVACTLVRFGLTSAEVWMLLCEYNLRCMPPWSERELRHKLQDAFEKAGRGPNFRPHATPQRPVPEIDPVIATTNYLNDFRAGEADLWTRSNPQPPDNWHLGGACLVSMLYASDERINIVTDYVLNEKGQARPEGRGITLCRDEIIRGLGRGDFESDAGGWIRMNPLDGRGVGDANVTAFRFALIECDGIPVDLQLSLFAKLPLPIAAILSSGGRSLHAWVKVDCKDANDYRMQVTRILTALANFGVDGQNKNPSRLSRLPGVLRKIGASADTEGRQRLLYLNTKPENRDRILS